MWIFLKDAFFGIVEHRDSPKHLLVRARYAGDIRKVFRVTANKELHTPLGDYPYRATITRAKVASIMAKEIASINYDNFKAEAAVHTPKRSMALHGVWRTMLEDGDDSSMKLSRTRPVVEDCGDNVDDQPFGDNDGV